MINLTKKRKLQILKSVLKEYENNTPGFMCLKICKTTFDLFNISLDIEDVFDRFPELWEMRPHWVKSYDDGWHPNTAYGIKKRKSILKKVINILEK